MSKSDKGKRKASLTPEDVAGIRDNLGLSIEDFAEVMGVVPQAVRYWENGLREIPRGPAILMQVFEDHPELAGKYET